MHYLKICYQLSKKQIYHSMTSNFLSILFERLTVFLLVLFFIVIRTIIPIRRYLFFILGAILLSLSIYKGICLWPKTIKCDFVKVWENTVHFFLQYFVIFWVICSIKCYFSAVTFLGIASFCRLSHMCVFFSWICTQRMCKLCFRHLVLVESTKCLSNRPALSPLNFVIGCPNIVKWFVVLLGLLTGKFWDWQLSIFSGGLRITALLWRFKALVCTCSEPAMYDSEIVDFIESLVL